MRFVWPTADSPFAISAGDSLELRAPDGAVVRGKVVEILETADPVYWTHLDEDDAGRLRAESAAGDEGAQGGDSGLPSTIEVEPEALLRCPPGAYLLIKLE